MNSKIVLTGFAIAMAIAVSASPSEAAKKKAKKMASCTPGTYCVSKAGVRQYCGGDGKQVAVLLPPCTDKACGPKC
jgi:hypothetical protein